MDCPICRRTVERVTLTYGSRSAVFVRCPACTPEAPDYSAFFAELWGDGKVTVAEALPGEALAALVRRLPNDPDTERKATALLAMFAARCWFVAGGPGDSEEKQAARTELAHWLNRQLGRLIGEGVPL